MAGELNFNLLNTNAPAQIANSVMAGQQMARQERMQVQQMDRQERMQSQQERLGGMQLRTAERDMASADLRQAGLDKFLRLSAENGKTGSPEELADSFFDFAVSSGDPKLIMSAQTTRQAARERNAYMESKQPISPDMPAPATNMLGQPPAAQPSANQLPRANEAASIESQIIRLQSQFPNVPAAQEEVKRLAKRLDDMTKSTTVAPGSSVVQGDRVVFTAPEPSTELMRNFNAAVAGGFRGGFVEYQAEIARAGRTPATAPAAQLHTDPESGAVWERDRNGVWKQAVGPGGQPVGSRKVATFEDMDKARAQYNLEYPISMAGMRMNNKTPGKPVPEFNVYFQTEWPIAKQVAGIGGVARTPILPPVPNPSAQPGQPTNRTPATARDTGVLPIGQGTAPRTPATAQFQAPDDVKAAYRSGKISETEAAKILRDNFGFK